MMSFIRFKVNNVIPVLTNNTRSLSAFINQSEYTKTPEYPRIVDVTPDAQKARIKQDWHEKIAALKTVEEKLFAINVPKYYGWHSLLLTEGTIPYNSLPLTQFITRTHLIENLPELYTDATKNEAEEATLSEVKSLIEDAIILEYTYHRRKQDYLTNSRPNQDLSPLESEDIIGKSVIQQINRILLASLSPKVPHLLEAQLDFDPRIESFWFVGQIEPPAVVRTSKEKVDRLKDRANESVDRCVQYLGTPALQLRSETPLSPFVDLQEYNDNELTVPKFTYDPRVLGVEFVHRHGTNIPGFWPGDDSEFGLLSYHSRGHILKRPPHYGEKDLKESLQTQAILASFGWTLGQACYKGFSTFNELTYPLASQTVITNGQIWSFYAYQLNTTLLHTENATNNPRRNFCWATKEEKLFEEVVDEKVVGFNDDVLRTLIKFYLNAPKQRDGVNMAPYLGTNVKRIADIDDEERRVWLESQYKHMYSNRPRHRLPYEVYDWERIYKIDHNTKPLDKKRRPFELGLNPYRRRYDEHSPKYIPKVHRPEDKKNKNKWSKTFHP